MRNKTDEQTFLQLEPVFLLLDDLEKVAIAKEYLVDGVKVDDIIRKHGVTKPVLYRAIAKFENAQAGYLAAEARKEMLLLDEVMPTLNGM